jgi:hypothetical protein
MVLILLALWMVFASLFIFLALELDWKTGEWKKERYKGKLLPF